MKDKRNPKLWSNREIQQDGPGYVQAQQAFAEDQELAEQQRRDADDERAWIENYIQQGGRENDAPAAWTKHRNERASEAAGKLEQAAMSANQRHIQQTL